MQHEHAARKCSKDMRHRHVAWTCSKDMQDIYEHAEWTGGMKMKHDMQYGDMNMQHGHGHAARRLT
jgi:hypothetical protein